METRGDGVHRVPLLFLLQQTDPWGSDNEEKSMPLVRRPLLPASFISLLEEKQHVLSYTPEYEKHIHWS